MEGDRVAVIGRTGSGKSTLVKSIFGFLDIHQGTLYIGGHNFNQYSPAYVRSKILTLQQQPFLFKGTLQENLQQEYPLDLELAAKLLR